MTYNEIYQKHPSDVSIIIIITYNPVAEIWNYLNSIQIILSSISRDGEPVIQFGLNMLFIYFKQ